MSKLSTVALQLGMVTTLWSQASAPLKFEVASIKQEDTTLPNRVAGGACHGSDAPGQVGIPGMTIALGRCRYVGAKVKQLINNAYGSIAVDRIVGGPDWIDSLPFSIDAKAEDSSTPTRAQLLEMMRTLLEERFKLKFHREMKEVPGFALVVGKDGIRLKPSAEGTRAGTGIRPGRISGSMSTSSLASSLTRAVGGPVIDGTGVIGRYDIDLNWSEDSSQPTTTSDPTGPSIFTAIQELGLRLEPNRSSIELFVIDSIEKPTSN